MRYLAAIPLLALVGCAAETSSPAAVDHFEVVSGAVVTGTPGWALSDPLIVRLVDERGAPVIGAAITWQVSAGGSLSDASATTGADGLAAAEWTLGLSPGDQSLRVSAAAGEALVLHLEAEPLAVHDIQTGASFGCGLDDDGQAWCWGDNIALQTGAADRAVDDPTRIGDGSLHFTQLALGDIHACGITVTGEVWCWGSDWAGQLGNGHTGPWPGGSATPIQAIGLPALVSLDAYGNRTCGLTAVGDLWCWGYGAGMTGSATPELKFAGTQFTRISVGYAHGCAIAIGGQVLCWGSNYSGQLGDGTFSSGAAGPQPIAVPLVASGIASTEAASCAIATAGRLYCWGFIHGLLNDSWEEQGVATPRLVEDGRAVRRVALGFNCAAVWFALGAPTFRCGQVRADIETLPSINEVAFGYEAVCLTVGTGGVYCKSYSDAMNSPLFPFEGRGIPAP